jgi:hypothetical protein
MPKTRKESVQFLAQEFSAKILNEFSPSSQTIDEVPDEEERHKAIAENIASQLATSVVAISKEGNDDNPESDIRGFSDEVSPYFIHILVFGINAMNFSQCTYCCAMMPFLSCLSSTMLFLVLSSMKFFAM